MNAQSISLVMLVQLCLINEFNHSVSPHNSGGSDSDDDRNNNIIHYNGVVAQNNCTFVDEDVLCECSLNSDTTAYKCYNIETSEDIVVALSHLLNTTKRYYWSSLEISCIEPFVTSKKSFHITSSVFTSGPKFEEIKFIGDCSKPKHYDNLIAIDKDVEKVVITKNVLRIATSCSLFQPKLEKLLDLTISESLLAGDMISATFSTRCLGQYGTRNEALPLVRLRITSCNVTLIESGAFFNFAELQLIDLSNNQLSHLSRQVFATHLYKLRHIYLQNNRLSALTADFFDKLPQLRAVSLAGNLLTTLPYIPVGGVPQVIFLEGNLWDCRCKLAWIVREKSDSQRFYDEPQCYSPENVKDFPLMDGLRFVDDTFC